MSNYNPFDSKDYLATLDNIDDARFNQYWYIAVFRGDYSKKDTSVYAVKVKSKLGDMVEKSFLYYDFIFQFAKIVKPVLGSIGYLDSKVIKQLQASADACVQNDRADNKNNPIIVLEGQGAIDILLNGAIADNVIDKYYNTLLENIVASADTFASRTNKDADSTTVAAWLDDDLYTSKSKYGREVLAVRDTEFKRLIGWSESDGIYVKTVVNEFIAAGYILPGSGAMVCKDITLSAEEKAFRCYVIDISRKMLKIAQEENEGESNE